MDRVRTKHAVLPRRGPVTRDDYAARGSADVRYEATDSEERRFGSGRLGYYRAIRTGGRHQAAAGDGTDLWHDQRPVSRCGYGRPAMLTSGARGTDGWRD